MIPSFGCDRPEKYQYAPMTQYFMKDYDPISNECRRPIDPSTHQPVELLPNGPLLDYLRVPYQFQQINETTMSAAQLMDLRREEVAKNWRRMVEVAQQEKNMHEMTEVAMQQAENQELLDAIEEGEEEEEVEENGEDNEEFKIGLSEEEEQEEAEEEEEEEEEMVGRRRVINSDSDVDEAELDGDDYAASVPSVRSVRSARTSRSARAGSTSRDVYARPYKTKRRESRNDEVREDGRCDG